MLDTLPIAAAMPDQLRVTTELARELRASRVAHMAIENTLIYKLCQTSAQFEDKVTRTYLGSDWEEYVDLLRDDTRLVDLMRLAEPAIAKLSPITMALVLGKERRTPYDPTNYSRLISNQIVDAITGRGPSTVVVNVPPRHGKSLLVSRRTPAWILANYPYEFGGAVGYSDVFMSEFGRFVRNDILDSPGTFGFSIAPDAAAASAWQTTLRGGFWTAGIGGSVTGRGCVFCAVDDTIKSAADAYSMTEQEAIWSWYSTAVRTRLQQGGLLVLICTRWHEQDLAGRVIQAARPGEIAEIVLPAICETDDDPLGRRKGEALWPSKYPLEALERTKRDVGPEAWQALYMQSPLGASKIGRCYRFEPDVHIVESVCDPSQRIYCAFDFNINPLCIVLAQVQEVTTWRDTSRQYIVNVFDELAIPDCNTTDGVHALGERLLKYARGQRLKITITGDASGARRQTSATNLGGDHQIIKDYFNAHTGQFLAKYSFEKSNMSVRESVAQVNGLFRTADDLVRFQIDPRCRETIEDLKTNRWKRDTNGNFLDTIDSSDPKRGHAGDALRYLIRALKRGAVQYGEQPVSMPR